MEARCSAWRGPYQWLYSSVVAHLGGGGLLGMEARCSAWRGPYQWFYSAVETMRFDRKRIVARTGRDSCIYVYIRVAVYACWTGKSFSVSCCMK